MKVLIDLCVIPLGVGVSVSAYVAECVEILENSGLQPRLHAYGTSFEGEWDVAFAAVKQCHERLHELGAPRIHTSMKVGTRTDRPQSLDDKIVSVEEKLNRNSASGPA